MSSTIPRSELKKKFYRLFVLPFANRRYIRLPAPYESVHPVDPAKLFIITIGFNEPELIALQYKALKKFIKDPYEYFVIDNSNNEDKAERIKQYCLDNNIYYVRLPENKGWNGMSHGFALNWTYRNIIQRFKPKDFGFMDHDLFPIHNVSIRKYLALYDAWGITAKRKPTFRPWERRLYLFIGLAFYRSEKFKNNPPNFFPAFGLDTGGRIWLDESKIMKLPDVHDFSKPVVLEISPNVKIRQYGDFVHFEGSSGEPPLALTQKKQWMENVLQSG